MDLQLSGYITYLLLTFALILFFFLSWRNPLAGAALILFLLPSYLLRIREGFFKTNVLDLLLITWLLAVGLIVLFGKKPQLLTINYQLLLRTPFLFPILLIALGAIISTLATLPEYRQASLGTLKSWVVLPTLFFFGLWLVRERIKIHQLFLALIFSALVVSLISLLIPFITLIILDIPNSSFITFDYRLRGFYFSPNHLAMYLAPILVLVIGYWLLAKEKLKKILILIALLTIAIAILLTQSIGAWFSLAGGLIIFYFLIKKSNIQPLVPFITLLALIILIIPIFISSPKFQDLSSLNPRSSLYSRLMVWRSAFEVGKDHPVFGIGLGTFQEYYLAYQKKFPAYLEWAVPQPHNLFLAFWLQTGLLGLSGFIWLLSQVIRYWILDIRKLLSQSIANSQYLISKIAAYSALTAIFLHGLIDTPFFKNDLSPLFLALVFFIIYNSNHSTQK